MQSFRTEFENPIVERDIIELEKKIKLFRDGKLDEEKFRSLRLARGVYGQRQEGVQMVRIKLPFGRVNARQLRRIAQVSDEYSTGNLHITTRQDIQIHYVSLDRTPQLWAELEKDDVTLREACGNTVRNITASDLAGIDPDEPFDVTPYANALFKYLLRNPVCQEMGRKFKISFSSSKKDTALTYIHDIGFIPKLKIESGQTQKGFKVMLGGGLGSQPKEAEPVFDFLPVDRIIPFTEAVLRVFDRQGERNRRMKARMKFLIKEEGLETFLEWVKAEEKAVPFDVYPIETFSEQVREPLQIAPLTDLSQDEDFLRWKQTNVLLQKQSGKVAVGVKVKLGNFSTEQARFLADLIENYATDELRFTLRQNLLIRHIPEQALGFFYTQLKKMGMAQPGYETTADITACPGTDTCNLGIASSTGIARVLEEVLENEYSQYLQNQDLPIKISGCMNACGQHNMAAIGYQGMSIRQGKNVAPALQVLLGGSPLGNGQGRFADKVIKIPSKRGPESLRWVLNDFEAHKQPKESFVDYYQRREKNYFYDLLKPLAETENLKPDDFIDWGLTDDYVQAIGVGECAGVVIDLIATMLLESEEKLALAKESLEADRPADSIYHSYAALINGAKALLLTNGVETNSQASVVRLFDEQFTSQGKWGNLSSFSDLVYQINQNKPEKKFAQSYLQAASSFISAVDDYRKDESHVTVS